MGRPWLSFGRGALLVLLGSAGTIALNPKLDFPLTAHKAAFAEGPVRLADETLELSGLEARFQELAGTVAPSVVAISAATSAIDSEEVLRSDDLNGEKLGSVLDGRTRIVGTGFVIHPDGYILTNEHVVGDAQTLWVTTDDHQVYPAVVIGSDPRADLAIVKIPARNLQPVTFATDRVRRGQWTIALGNPYGLAMAGEMAMSVGVVSAIDRSLPKLANKEDRLYSNLIQTTAEINPGNSGGPLFDLQGRVIGINTAVILPQKQTNGIGFAMPINDRLLGKIEALKQGREITYGYLGVRVVSPTARQLREAGLTRTMGAVIETIEPDSPAHTGKLQVGDLVTALDGRTVHDSDHFVRLIGESSPVRPTRLSVVRGRRELSLDITVGRRSMPSVAINRENQRFRWRGMLLGPIPSHWSEKLDRAAGGLMVLAVEKSHELAPRDVNEGSIITAVANKAVASIADLQRIINETPAAQCSVQVADPTPGKSAVVALEP